MRLFLKLGKLFENTKNGKISEKETEKDFGVNTTNETPPKNFDLDYITSFLNETHQKHLKELKTIANIKYKEIQKNTQLFETSLKKLNKADFKKNFGSNLTRANKSHLNLLEIHRKNFIEKSQNLLKQLRKPLSDANSIAEYHKKAISLLHTFNKRSLRDFVFFKNLLKQESNESLEAFKELSSKINDFNAFVWEQNNQVLQIKQAQNILSTIKIEKENLNNNKKESIVLNTELKNQKIKEENLKKQIKILKEDSEYFKNKELQKILQQELSKTKSEIRTQAFSIEHALKKFIYSAQKSGKMAKDKIKLTNKFLESPLAVLSERANTTSLNLILKKFKAEISENKLKVKNKEKIDKKLNEILNQNFFEKLILKYNSIHSKLTELERSKLINHIEKQKTIEKDLEQVKKDIETKSHELQQLKKSNSEKEELVENEFLGLKDILNSMNFN